MVQVTISFPHPELGELEVGVDIDYPAGHEAGIGWDIQSVVGVETEVDYDPDEFYAYLEKSGHYDEFDRLVHSKAE